MLYWNGIARAAGTNWLTDNIPLTLSNDDDDEDDDILTWQYDPTERMKHNDDDERGSFKNAPLRTPKKMADITPPQPQYIKSEKKWSVPPLSP